MFLKIKIKKIIITVQVLSCCNDHCFYHRQNCQGNLSTSSLKTFSPPNNILTCVDLYELSVGMESAKISFEDVFKSFNIYKYFVEQMYLNFTFLTGNILFNIQLLVV